MLFYILVAIIYLPVLLLYPTKIIHKDRMPKGKVLVTSNHYSMADPLIMVVKFNRWFRFVGKKELFKNKFLAWVFKGIGVIPVDRQSMSPSTFKEVIGSLKKNRSVFIFPEGTRNKNADENLQDVKMGVITFASKGESQIVPMVIYNKPRLFRKNYIIVGEPIDLVGENIKRLTKEEQEENLNRYIEAMNNLRTELDEYVVSKKRKKSSK